MKIIFYIAVLIATLINLHAQEEMQTVELNIHELSFIKNNEYFNHIADGYTLLGTYLLPELDYSPHRGFHLKAGPFLHRYWGADTLNVAYPFIQMEYRTVHSIFRVGSIRNADNHGLIQPIMGVENILTKNALESGVQYLFTGNKMHLDASLNWKRFIFKKSPFQEEIFHALTWQYKWFDTKGWVSDVYLQNTLYHRGGQINTTPPDTGNVFTMLHTVWGLDIHRNVSSKSRVYGDAYFIRYAAQSDPAEYIFHKGYAWFSHAGFIYRDFNFYLGHWFGYHFVAPYGDDMFQSVSRVTETSDHQGVLSQEHAGYTDPVRSLLLIGANYEKKIFDGFQIRLTAKAFYQNYYSNPTPDNPANTVQDHWDYSFGLYFSYSGSLRLWDNIKSPPMGTGTRD